MGQAEWHSIPDNRPHVLKLGDNKDDTALKFMACPVSTITAQTWEIIKLLHECTSAENTDLLHLPYPGTILDQPPWFREAVHIMKSEKARHRKEQMEKPRGR